MTDKEMMELAAKAVGRLLPHGNPALARSNEELHHGGEQYWFWPTGDNWNPLTDDGDALRLAVELNVHVLRFESMTTASPGLDAICCDERDDGDPYAATRRAITRAAAEIGKLK